MYLTWLTVEPPTDSGAQPLTNEDESIILAVNGEIYNHRVIRKHLKNKYHFKTHSDCEVIIPLVRRPLASLPTLKGGEIILIVSW